VEINDLIAMLTEGLPAENAAQVRAAMERDVVKSKVSGLRQQSEYQTLADQQARLQAELEGGPDKPGAKAYQKWYDENFAKIQQMQTAVAAYQEKYGSLEAPTTQQPQPGGGRVPTEEDIQRMVDARIGNQYAPRWSNLLTDTGTIVQKHMFAGRKTPIDFGKLAEIAKNKNGDLQAAYDEWDKPEREKAEADAREKDVEKRVQERLQKMNVQQQFPSGADMSSHGALASRTKSDVDKFDKTSLQKDLFKTFLTGEAPENVQ
jgi:hypothetical protein